MPHSLAQQLAEHFAAFRERREIIEHELLTYKSLLDVCPCPMVLLTADGLVTYVNLSYLELFGVSLSQVTGDGWKCVVHPDDLAQTIDTWKKVYENKIPDYNGSTTFILADHTVIRCGWRAKLLPLNVYAIAIFHPICQFAAKTGCSYASRLNHPVTGT